jgi:hypothetical protein
MDAVAPARDGVAGRAMPVSHHDPRDRHGAVTASLFGFGGEHARASECSGRDVRGRQKRVVPTPGACASSLAVMKRPDRARASVIRKTTGAIAHRSPRRARHKPLKPFAQGRPGCFRHHLWSPRVRSSRADRGCQPAPGLPCALLIKRVERRSKARAKCAARMRKRVR